VAEPLPAGSDVSAGTYRCTECGDEIQVGSTKHLPPCPLPRLVTNNHPRERPAFNRCTVAARLALLGKA
jgi:zinc ribbon family protein